MSAQTPYNIGPLAPERNPPITPEYYSPNIATLSTITPISRFSTRIVTTADNEFVVGQTVRFIIPPQDGMRQINGRQAYVTSIDNATTFYVQIDTLDFDTFNAAGTTLQDPFVIAIGDVNSGQINSSGRINNITYIPGSFINIGPQ